MADFHSKMSVCRHEQNWGVQPPTLPAIPTLGHRGPDTTPPTFDPQGSMKVLDSGPCNNCYTVTTGGRGREERKGRTPSIS